MEALQVIGRIAGWFLFIMMFLSYAASLIKDSDYFSHRAVAPILLAILLTLLLVDLEGVVQFLIF